MKNKLPIIKRFVFLSIICLFFIQSSGNAQDKAGTMVSIQKFGVLPGNKPEVNRDNLQKAIDWATVRGAALWIEPVEDPYEIAGGVILKRNVSLIGVHGPTINHTDNAQLMDLFTFAAYGGILLGPESYGQLTNFNLDCVTVGIHKMGNNTKNRNWQIAQGSIIANIGRTVEEIHPIIQLSIICVID